MQPITAEEMLQARIELGKRWGLGRQLTTGEIGHLVGLAAGSAADTIFQIETGKRQPSGPVSLVVRAMLDGWEPPHKTDVFRATKASTSPRGPHGMAAMKPAGRPVIGARGISREVAEADELRDDQGRVIKSRSGTTWAGDPRKEGEGDGEE